MKEMKHCVFYTCIVAFVSLKGLELSCRSLVPNDASLTQPIIYYCSDIDGIVTRCYHH